MNARANAIHPQGDRIDALISAFEKFDQRLGREHAENLSVSAEHQREVNERLDALQRAFPGGDPEGHRRFHEALIEQAAERAKFWRELRGKLMERGIWAAGLFLVGLLVLWLKGEIK